MNIPDNGNGLLVLAVDDERIGLDLLNSALQAHPKVRRVIPVNDPADALRQLGTDEEVVGRRKAGRPALDAAFVDINMPGLTGVELANVFNALDPRPSLVFVTGIQDEAVRAFELGAVDYLLKPINPEKIDRAVHRVIADRAMADARSAPAAPVPAQGSEDEVIPVELAGTTKLISRNTVRWIEAQGDYARLHTTDGNSHLVRIPLAQLEERWGSAGFVRIHRSYLVALQRITELRMTSSGYTVLLGDEKELPVSRRHTRDLKDRLVRPPGRGGG